MGAANTSPDPAPASPLGALARRAGRYRGLLAYAVLATIWALLSDSLASKLFIDPGNQTLASALNDLAFVALSTALFYRHIRRQEATEGAGGAAAAATGRGFFFFAAMVVVLTSIVVKTIYDEQKTKETETLKTISALKSEQVAIWLKERRGDGGFLQNSHYLAENYLRWADKGEQAGMARLLGRLDEFRSQYDYGAVLVIGPQGQVLWHSETLPHQPDPTLLEAVRLAQRQKQARLLGPYRHANGELHLDLIVPLTLAGAPAPCLILHTSPSDWLFRTLQSWPVPSRSGETLLFRKDGDHILYLNDLRYRPGSAATLRIPLGTPGLLASVAVDGAHRPGELLQGVDYRGVRSVGMAQPVPGTDWQMIVKKDRDEFFGTAHQMATWSALTALLVLVFMFSALRLARQRQALLLAAQTSQAQVERLRALRLLASIANSSDDAIMAKDLEGRYMLFNRACEAFTGKPADDVLGKDDFFLFPAEQAELLQALGKRVLAEKRVITTEENLATPQGLRTFLATKGPLYDDEGQVIGLFGISRDVTEQQQIQANLQHQRAELLARNEELERFNQASVGRELDMIRLKAEINTLSAELGRAPPYALAFLDADGAGSAPADGRP